MSVGDLQPVENQVYAPGVGDIDDCFAVALRRAMRASGLQPASIAAIRAAAGVPDEPGPTGATPSQVYAAARELARPARPWLVRGFEHVVACLGAGKSAVIFYRAGRLPPAYRYGFTGDHAGGLEIDGGTLYLSDPLAPDGSPPRAISASALRLAMEAFPDGAAAVVLTEVPMSIYRTIPTPGTFVIEAGTSVKGYQADGSAWKVVKTWDPRPVDSSGPFDYRLSRMSGVTVPSSLLHVTDGYFAGLYVDTAQVSETYEPTDKHVVTLAVDGEVKATVEVPA
jgi:hypothetical protein